ncbi:MAG: hydroxyacid dehydrogenase [Clostridia bacterium]|nr:hydroxyacid dehydrogenase [Clostridia bacterium]
MTALFVTRRFFNIDAVYSSELQAKLKSELTFLAPVKSEAELEARKEELQTVDYIFSTWGMLPLTKEQILTYFPNLKSVFYAAGTVQAFARPFLELGISVHSAWKANGIPVAEVTVSEILLADKGFFHRRVRSRSEWDNRDPEYRYPGNYGTKVGILGAGMIGARVIELLRPFELELYVFDPFLSDERAEALGVKKASLEEIFENCHIVSNHLANKPETVGIIRRDLLARMGEYAVFINTGRGAQVDTAALVDEMRAHPYRMAILDVTDPEEPPKEGNPLYGLDNVILTPHIAGSIGYETHRLADFMYEEYRAVAQGKEPRHAVSLAMLETMA